MERQREEDRVDGEDARAKRARIEGNKEALFDHVHRGDLEALQSLVNRMSEEDGERAELINSTAGREGTILHFAVGNGHLHLIKWILSDSGGRAAGFNNILAKTEYGLTALHIATRNGRFDVFLAIVEGLKVENGEGAAMLNAINIGGRTVLNEAMLFRREDIVKWLLSEKGREAGFDRDTVFAFTNSRLAILHHAVSTLSVDCLDFILSQCNNAEERRMLLFGVDSQGYTVLHHAAVHGGVSVLKWVVSHQQRERGGSNEDLFTLTSDNKSVLHLAVASNHSVDFLDLILEQCRNAEERCKLLFGFDKHGYTVLHHAVNETISAVEWVTSRQQEERGGSNEDLFALTNDKESFLHVASEVGFVECFDFLLSRCNNTSERLRLFLGRDNKGWTIFYHAAQCQNSGIISHILRKYPEESKMIINTRDYRGMTVLHRIIIHGLDNKSRGEWGIWQTDGVKRELIAALFGLEGEDDENDDDDDDDRDDDEGDTAGMSEEEEREKKPVDVKAVVIIAAAGADPNVGLKFD